MAADHDRSSGPVDASSGAVDPLVDGIPGTIEPREGDPLSDVLETIRLQGALFFLWRPCWDYVENVPDAAHFTELILPGADRVVSYHIVMEGPCWASVAGQAPVRLDSGDTLLVPHGDAYAISSRPTMPSGEVDLSALDFFRRMAAGELPPVVEAGGAGPEFNRLICGFLGCERHVFHPVLDTLPRLLRVPAPGDAADPLDTLANFAISEAEQHRGGERCLLTRLSEVMFVEVLRRYLRTASADSTGWLTGLRDPLVGRALHLLHAELEAPWTLEELARRLATSRSTLAERFATLVGEPPMQYLTRWRMQAAACRLAGGGEKIYAVARETGYESEAAFSRAFKRVVGVTPTQWRQHHQHSTARNGPASSDHPADVPRH